MKVYFPDEQVFDTCARLIVIAGVLPAEIRELRVRALIPVGDDGWPAGGGEGGGKGGHSDRTGETVVRREERPRQDPINTALMDAIGNLLSASHALEKALGACASTKHKPPVEVSPLQFCRSCERAKGPSGLPLLNDDVYRTRLCRRCYEWAAAHDGEWPPVLMLELRERKGKPLNAAEVAQFETEKEKAS